MLSKNEKMVVGLVLVTTILIMSLCFSVLWYTNQPKEVGLYITVDGTTIKDIDLENCRLGILIDANNVSVYSCLIKSYNGIIITKDSKNVLVSGCALYVEDFGIKCEGSNVILTDNIMRDL